MAINRNAINAKALDTLTIDSIDVGGTSTEYTLTISTTRIDILIEQQFAPVKRIKTNMSANSTVSLAEFSLANLAIAYDQPAANIVSCVLTIDSTEERGEVTFVAVGKAGSGVAADDANDRTFSFPQTTQDGDAAYNLGKETASSISTSWNHVTDTSGVIGTITDAAV